VQRSNKLPAAETDFWRRPAKKSRRLKFGNDAVRVTMDVGKNMLEVTEEKRLRWFGHVKRMPGNRRLSWGNPRIGTRGNTKEGKTRRRMDGWRKTEYFFKFSIILSMHCA
jgi:hypothetical protein